MSCAVRSPGVKGICANWAALHRADSLSCQSLGFLVEARYSTEPILEKKELNDYTSTHILPP